MESSHRAPSSDSPIFHSNLPIQTLGDHLQPISPNTIGPSSSPTQTVTLYAPNESAGPESSSSSPIFRSSCSTLPNYYGFHSASSSSLSQVAPTGVGAGLLNLGNTCFMNAILQCFTHTVPLVEGLRSSNHSKSCPCGGNGFCVICFLHDHFELSLSSSGWVISPLKLVDNLNYISSCFERFQQEDAHEFLQCLLDRLERCLDLMTTDKSLSSTHSNLVKQVFGGRFISKLRCCSCSHYSDTHEPLIDLSLEIEHVDTLPLALESFTKVEKIEDPETKFMCENCKEKVLVEKQLMLEQAPTVAAFHLKRFKTDGSHVEKIDKHVGFPLELDMQPYMSGSNNNNMTLKYDLYAIVVHIGCSSTSGHYFSFIRSSPDTWHCLDDSKVTRVHKDFVLSQEAYILFYARQGTPWFSNLMGVQKQCGDLKILSTSPQSVLDNLDSVSPPCVSNIKSCEANRSPDSAVEVCEIYSGTRESDIQPEEIRNSTAEINPMLLPRGSIQDKCSVNEAKDGCNDTTYDIFHSLTPPTSPSPGNSVETKRGRGNNSFPSKVQYQIPRDHLKPQKHVSCKKQLNKALEDDQRKEALRYATKCMSGSRRAKLVEVMLDGQNAGDNKKRLAFSPNEKSTPPSARRKTSHLVVTRPVLAGTWK